MNEIKLSGRVISIRETAKMKVVRLMFRNTANQTGFINVLCPKETEVREKDEVVCLGNLSMSEREVKGKDDEKKKLSELFIWATSVEATTKEAF